MVADPLAVDVFADIACPWCFIGKRRLERALAGLAVPAEVRWHAFMLQPDLPPEGAPAREFFTQKFGGDPDAVFARVVEEGRSEGIAFDFGAMPKAPNTMLAHRAVALAAEQSRAAQDAAEEALFSAYFEHGADVTDATAVLDALRAAGVPADLDVLAAGLATGGGAETVGADLRVAAEIGVTAVPTFIADHRYGVPGALPPDQLRRLLNHALLERESRAA